jgi:hypothetical protein
VCVCVVRGGGGVLRAPCQLGALQCVELALLQQHAQVDQDGWLLPGCGGHSLEALHHLLGAQDALCVCVEGGGSAKAIEFRQLCLLIVPVL